MPLLDSGSALFAGSASEFARMAPASSLTSHVTSRFTRLYGRPPESEIKAWKNSLTALARVLDDSGVDASGVGVELRLPSSNRRIDVSLVARDESGQPTVQLIELKQWESAKPSMSPDNVVLGDQEKLHPSVQVAAYAEYLRMSHSAFTEHGFQLSACAYLHNMSELVSRPLKSKAYREAVSLAPLFAKGDEEKLADLLSRNLGNGDGMELLPKLVSGRHSPSKKLIEGIAKAIKGSPIWTLIDEQRVAYNLVRGHVQRAAESGEKAAVLVIGGPGTGKSVIALHLLLDLSKQFRVAHTTASKAFTTNLRAIAGRGSEGVFCWNKDFAHRRTDENSLDLLIIDEAHRVRKTSNMRFTPRAVRSEMAQANELIRASRVSVFLLDERQNVRPDEIGTVSAIEDAALEEGVEVVKVPLDAQFRCNGSSKYIEWVDALFSDNPRQVEGWAGPGGEYEISVCDSPQQMEDEVRRQVAAGANGRLVAGYCWPWSDPNPDKSLEPDIVIGSWKRPWNEKSPEQKRKPGAAPRPEKHPYTQWATQPKGLTEIGCIYSAQGFEFDYCGVILGPDLVWRAASGWVADRGASCDNAVRRGFRDPEHFSALLQHTYRVLMTRGMLGTYVYSVDSETQELLRRLTKPPIAISTP